MLELENKSEDITEIMIEDICNNMKDVIFQEKPKKLGHLSSLISYSLPIHSANESGIDVRCIDFHYMMNCVINVSNIPLESEDFGLYFDAEHCAPYSTHDFYKIFAEYCFKIAYIQVKINDPEVNNYLGAGVELTLNKDHIYKQIQKLFLKKQFVTNTWHHFLKEFNKLKYAIRNNVRNQVVWTPSNQEQNSFRIPTQYFPYMAQMPNRSISDIESDIRNMDTFHMEYIANLLTKSLPIHSASEMEPEINITDSAYVTRVILIADSPHIRVNNWQSHLKISMATIPPEDLSEDTALLFHYFEFLFKSAFYNYLSTYYVDNNYQNSFSILLNEDERLTMLPLLMDESFVLNAGRMFLLYLYNIIIHDPNSFHWQFPYIPPIPQYNNLVANFADNTSKIISYEYEIQSYCDSIFDS